jgi:hypothetical protein
MISEGTNLPRLRVVVILRDIGNRTFYEQLVHRITRNDADDRPQDAFIVQLQLPHLHEWACDLEHQALIGWEKRKQAPPEPGTGGDPPPAKFIEGICAEQQRETVVIENQDFTDTDPTARILVDRIGAQTRGTRWMFNMALRELEGLGIPLNGASTTPPDKEELFSIDEQIKRYRESGNNNCKKAALNLKRAAGGGDFFGQVFNQCKKAAGIKGSLEDVSRDHGDPLEAMKRFAEAARRAVENSLRRKRDDGEQGALL